MFPSSQVISRIRESASLKVEDMENRVHECNAASASSGVHVAVGVLVHAWLQKIKGARRDAAQLAAAAVGAGYATGRRHSDFQAQLA